MGVFTSAFVIAGCSSVPLMYNNYNKQRLDTLCEFEELFRDVLQEINHLLTPIPMALVASKKHRSKAVQKTVDDFIYGLSKSHASNVSDIWKGAILYNQKELQLKNHECDILCKFGEYIDSQRTSNKCGIEESLRLVLEKLDELITNTKTKNDKYGPMFNKLGLLCGVGLSLFTI